MMIVMQANATQTQISAVVAQVESMGMQAHLSSGKDITLIAVVSNSSAIDPDQFLLMPGVDRTFPITRPYKLASREFHPENTSISVRGLNVGGEEIAIIGGPCSVEGHEQLMETADAVLEAGGHGLRGGAFKPRTSPYSFQGMGEEGLKLLAEARKRTGMPVWTEVMAPEQVPLVAKYADVFQIGTRNMQNYDLLKAVGESQKPVMLKRGMSATIEEFLMSAEYILSCGNRRVMLCERGIRTFENSTRNTTDINAVPVLKSLTHLPVIVDPSHSTGHWEYVEAISRASIAAGADGLIIEVHPQPDKAVSDGAQSLKPERFAGLVQQVDAIAKAMGRTLAPRPTPTI